MLQISWVWIQQFILVNNGYLDSGSQLRSPLALSTIAVPCSMVCAYISFAILAKCSLHQASGFLAMVQEEDLAGGTNRTIAKLI